MKKIQLLIALGAFVLATAVLARAYAYPRLAVVPFDLDARVVAENPAGDPATYFSIPDLAEVSGELGNQTKARVDLERTEQAAASLGEDVVVLETYACTDAITIDCSAVLYPLSATLSTFAVDRRTGEPVAWSEASVETGGKVDKGVEFEGLTIKFPFNAQKQTYHFWNADLRTSVPVEFIEETTYDGLAAYKFRGRIAPTVLGQLDVPGSLVDSPEAMVTIDRVTSSETTYVVEPESGVIISAASVQDSYATFDGERAFTITDGTFVTPQEAAADTVATYRPLAKALFAVRILIPIGGSAVGALLILAGLLLARRYSRTRSAPPESQTGPRPSTTNAGIASAH